MATPGSVVAVIPTRNGARFIGDTIGAALAQTRPPQRLIFVDDHSTDDTAAIVREHPGVELWSATSSGPNAARAQAISATSSDYVALLDHDDIWFEHHVEVLAGALDRHPVAAAAFGERVWFERSVEPPARRPAEPTLVDPWDDFPANVIGGPSCVVMRRRALERVGGWPAWPRVPSDIFMWLRLAEVGPFARWAEPTLGHRLHEASMSRALRRSDLVEHLHSTLALLEEALDLHRERWPGDREALSARHDEFQDLVDIIAAIGEDRSEDLQHPVERIARRGVQARSTIETAQRELRGMVERRPHIRPALWRSILCWPRGHRTLRRRLVDPVVQDVLLTRQSSRWRTVVRSRPHRAVPLLLAKLRTAVGRRVHRVDADPR